MTKQEFLAFSLPYELHGITANHVALINGVEYEKELPIIWRGEKFSGRCGFGIMGTLNIAVDSDINHNIDCERHISGNYFCNKEQAQRASDLLKAELDKFWEKELK